MASAVTPIAMSMNTSASSHTSFQVAYKLNSEIDFTSCGKCSIIERFMRAIELCICDGRVGL